jgi:hypothetical protein
MSDAEIRAILADAWNQRLANEVPGNHHAVMAYMRTNPGMSYEEATAAMPCTYSAVMPAAPPSGHGMHELPADQHDAVMARMYQRPGTSFEAAAAAVLSPAEYARVFPRMQNQSSFRELFG